MRSFTSKWVIFPFKVSHLGEPQTNFSNIAIDQDVFKTLLEFKNI